MKGILIWWSDIRQFGFVEVKVVVDGGWKLDKFYLNRAHIDFCACEPKSGCVVQFDMADSKSNRPTDYPVAVNAKIYPSPAQAGVLALSIGLDAEQASKTGADAVEGGLR